MKRNDGFTLVELLATLAAGALVTFAAISLILLGARIQYHTTQEAKEQQTIRVVMTLLEDMAGSGDFDRIQTTYNGWQLLKDVNTTPANLEDDSVIFEYVNTEQIIYRGEKTASEPILTGLNNAGVVMEGNLLRLSFETNRGENYVTRVYCRTADVKDTQEEEVKEEIADKFNAIDTSLGARYRFLETLAAEYGDGNNTGIIQNPGGEPYTYYSEWYIDGYEDHPGWNKDTPWCACFLSWAAEKNGISGFKFANVDTGKELFDKAGKWKHADSGYTPMPGDYIFFDWSGQKKDPAHVGAVLDVDTVNGLIYTIEGNSSGRVAVRMYAVNDDPVILGYGVLPAFAE